MMSEESKKGESLPPGPHFVASPPPSTGTPRNAPYILCVTGKMAAGKNFICSGLEKQGFVSVDLDELAHEAISFCTPQILSAFEEEAKKRSLSLLNDDGSVNRRALAQIVFSGRAFLSKQESIVYPKIIELTNQFIEKNKEKSVILNATVLFKTPELLKKCEKIIFVTANPLKRFFRARKRDHLPIKQILARFKNQKKLLAEYKNAARSFNIPIEIIKN